jgi:hypothetical protein
MNTKMCRKCGKIKPIDDFYKGSSKQDNRHPYCKDCAKRGAKQATIVNVANKLVQRDTNVYNVLI